MQYRLVCCATAAALLLVYGTDSATADDPKLADATSKELKQVEAQVRRQLKDIFGARVVPLKHFDTELPKLTRLLDQVALYVDVVNKNMEVLFGGAHFSLERPKPETSVTDIDGKIMTSLLQRIEDTEIILRLNWNHVPK